MGTVLSESQVGLRKSWYAVGTGLSALSPGGI